MDNGFGLFTKCSRPEVFAARWLNANLRCGDRFLYFLRRNATRIEPSSSFLQIFDLVESHRFQSIRFENQETLSLSFSLSNIILSFSTREEKEIEGKTRFLISEASIDRSLHSLSLRFPFPRYYFVAVSDPFTKQSR